MENNLKIQKVIIASLFLVFLASCNSAINLKKEKEDPLQGVWQLNAFYTLANTDQAN